MVEHEIYCIAVRLIRERSIKNFVNPSEKPNPRFWIEVDQRENVGPVELVLCGPPRIPTIPFFSISNEDVEGLNLSVPTGEVNLVVSGVRDQ